MPEEKETFADWLVRISDGRANREATAALRDISRAVVDQNAKGSVIITVGLEPVGKTGYQVQASTSVTKKMPKAGAEVTVHFVDDEGLLHRDDPYQGRLTAPEPEGSEK